MTEAPKDDGVQMKIIADAQLLQDILDALQSLVHEARFQFLQDHIRVWVVDPANAAAVYVDLNPATLDGIRHYSVEEGGLQIGLNLGKLDGYLGYADGDTPVQLSFGEAHNYRFELELPGVDAFIAGIDAESIRKEPDKPDLDWPAQFDLPGQALKDAHGLNDMITDQTTVVAEDHQVQFVANGDTNTNTFTLVEGESELQFIEHPDERQETMISLDYLGDMVNPMKGRDVRLKMGTDIPMMFETDLFTMMLAPRIDISH